MDSQTCTAAVVTPYPSPASQAQTRAGSRPQSSRRPSPHPHNRLPQPNPAFPVVFPQRTCLITTQTLVKRSRTHTQRSCKHTHVGQPSSQPITRITPTTVHPISPKLSSNTHERSHNAHANTHPCRPSLITARHPNHANYSSPNLTQTLTNTRKHSYRRPTALPAVSHCSL